jgi:regulator of protease activity HflC (stomatin/prohibitin superfamily)
MNAWRKRFTVFPAQRGCLYRNYQLLELLDPGIYRYWDFRNELALICLPRSSQMLTVTNQEVLTQDQIALRCSYFVMYAIVDYEAYLRNFDVFAYLYSPLAPAEQMLHSYSQLVVRSRIGSLDSQTLNGERDQLFVEVPELLQTQMASCGIEVKSLYLRDLSFPKTIQELFAKQLEAQIRAKTDLENARTVVAATRALKNAADMARGDEQMRYLQWLETLSKIAAQGKHTFVLGDPLQLPATPPARQDK